MEDKNDIETSFNDKLLQNDEKSLWSSMDMDKEL